MTYFRTPKHENMKKTLLTIVLASVGVSVFAQKKPLTIPVQNYPEHYFEALEALSAQQPLPDAVADARPSVQPSAVVDYRGGAIWSEDFGNGFPTGWAVDDASGINPWKWSLNGSHGNFNGTNALDYADPISSTTASNGFLISDPDSANHFNYGQPSGTTYQYLNSYFATSEIDLGASYSSLLLQFEQSFRFNNSVDLVVQVSADSVTWVDYTVQGGVDNNTASDDPELVSINISGAVGNSQSVFLRIGWNARVYYWMIDDMRIIEGLDSDLELTKAYHGDIVLDYQYSRIPLEQTSEMVIGAVVTNLGGITQTSVTVDYDILLDGSSVSSGSFAFTDDIVAADSDTAWHSTGFTPSQIGEYEVVMTVSSPLTDENTTNQEGSSTFEVTEFLFAHDYEDQFEIQVWGQEDANGDANPYGHGNVFIPPNDGSSVYAFEVAFGSNTTPNTSVIAEVHELGSSIQDIVDSYVSVYDINSSDINGGSNFSYTTIVLDEGVPLSAGIGYTIALQSEGGDDEMWILANQGDEDFSTTLYGPYGAGGAVNWYNGYAHTPAIRMNLNPDIASVDDDIAQYGFGLFPNPAADQLNIRFDVNAGASELRIHDVSGKLVERHDLQQNQSLFSIDLSRLDAGMYLVSVMTENGSATQRLIVQ